jgi:hypothetical protein
LLIQSSDKPLCFISDSLFLLEFMVAGDERGLSDFCQGGGKTVGVKTLCFYIIQNTFP